MNETTLDEMDDTWISNFEKNDLLYKNYYKEDLYFVNLKLIYINKENEIDKIRQQPLLFSVPNTLLREEMIGILKKNISDDGKKYELLSILTYNITLNPDEINTFLMVDEYTNYLKTVTHIDRIYFEKSIQAFHDINDLILIFYEKTKSSQENKPMNKTKKVYIRKNINRKAQTKRII